MMDDPNEPPCRYEMIEGYRTFLPGCMGGAHTGNKTGCTCSYERRRRRVYGIKDPVAEDYARLCRENDRLTLENQKIRRKVQELKKDLRDALDAQP